MAARPERERWIAHTEQEWKDLMANPRAKIIRTKTDWQKLLRSKENPLADCSTETAAAFTRSLRFRNGGLAGANFSGVGKELNYFQFKRLWASFGMGMDLFADHENYECKSRGTCSFALANICTSNC
jgi:hypothetical protein